MEHQRIGHLRCVCEPRDDLPVLDGIRISLGCQHDADVLSRRESGAARREPPRRCSEKQRAQWLVEHRQDGHRSGVHDDVAAKAQILRNMGVTTCVVCGVTTAVCVSTTIRGGVENNYRMMIVKDAVAEVHREAHEAELRTMQRIFADVKSTDEIIDMLPRRAAA